MRGMRGDKNIDVDIWGSCVTRDAFAFDKAAEYNVRGYFTGLSLISLYSEPTEISLNDIPLTSDFQKRVIYDDFTKSFKKYIGEKPSPFLIIDFIDERFAVLRKGNCCITESNEFRQSGLAVKAEPIKGPERMKLWKERALLFIEEITSCYASKKIILHKAFWRERYATGNGEEKSFDESYINDNNKRLTEYYRFIEENIPGIKTIVINDFNALETHKWGLAPFHYQDAYYLELLEQLRVLVRSSGGFAVKIAEYVSRWRNSPCRRREQ